MSKELRAELEARRQLIEKSMRQARIERSQALWDSLQRLFSRPEISADDANAVTSAKLGLRFG